MIIRGYQRRYDFLLRLSNLFQRRGWLIWHKRFITRRVGRDHIFQKIYVHISLYHDDDDGETCTHLAAAAVADLFLCYLDLRPMLQNFLCVCPNRSTVWPNWDIFENYFAKFS